MSVQEKTEGLIEIKRTRGQPGIDKRRGKVGMNLGNDV